MKTSLEYFNKTATSWSSEWLYEKQNSKVAQIFFELYSKVGNFNPKILDAGCGAGYDSYILSNFGADVVGVDFSEKLIEIAKNNVINCSFFVKNIENPLVDLGKFDGVFCTSVLNFIDIINLKQVFDNFAEIMKKGAILFVSTLDGNGFNESRSFSVIDGEEYDLKFFNLSAEQLCGLAKHNFRLVDTFKFDDFKKGYKYYAFLRL